jgi:TPR repeat protein
MKLIRIMVVFVLFSTLAACASESGDSINGDAFKQGQVAFKTGDYKSAFHLLYPLAMDGQPDAQYAIGYMIYYGKGVVRNQQIGQAWIREAAVHGQAQAEQAMQLLTQKGMFDIAEKH